MNEFFFSILFSTFILEDIALVSSLTLVAEGKMTWTAAFMACFLGISIGDILLYLVGRGFAQFESYFQFLQNSWWQKKFPKKNSAQGASPMNTAIVLSRFIPGTRLPTYLAAGFFRHSFISFLALTVLSVFGWVLLAFIGGASLIQVFKDHWVILAACLLILMSVLKSVVPNFLNAWDRKAYLQSWRKWTHFEFWPAWFFYIPILLDYFYLSFKHRSLFVPMDSNPRILHGGFIGESKWDFYQYFKNDPKALKTVLIPLSTDRDQKILQLIESKAFQFPLILKPDMGQRGFAVRILRDLKSLENYLAEAQFDLILQEFCDLKEEAGIFYYRYPGSSPGTLFSITTKKFPQVIGDGKTKVGDLILQDPRAKIIAATYFERHRQQLDHILPKGQSLLLSECGNHCQGAIFLNGEYLKSKALLASIEKVASQMPDFYIGRFDIRFRSDEKLMLGQDYKIIEVNGASSEATHIWDPKTKLSEAYRVLFQQWKTVFAIGQAVRDQKIPRNRIKKIQVIKEIINLLKKDHSLNQSS